MIERLLYSKKEAAALLSLSVATVDVLIARGSLKVRRMGVRVMISRKELERFASCDHPAPIWERKEHGKVMGSPETISKAASGWGHG